MKTLKLMVAAAGLLLSAGASRAAIPYTPPEFVASDWTDCGMGSYEAGVFDYFDGEYPGVIPCQMYKNVNDENEIWVEPIVSDEILAEIEAAGQGLQPAGPFIIHVGNPDKVWVTPVWSIHPLIFCFYQLVPEVMGVQGSDQYYGTLNGLKVTFPEKSFVCGTLPSGTPASNIGGNFAVNLPDPSGVTEVETQGDLNAVYYNLYGVKIDRPQSGEIYIMKTGNKAKKVVF